MHFSFLLLRADKLKINNACNGGRKIKKLLEEIKNIYGRVKQIHGLKPVAYKLFCPPFLFFFV
jgi:hypothetical protein